MPLFRDFRAVSVQSTCLGFTEIITGLIYDQQSLDCIRFFFGRKRKIKPPKMKKNFQGKSFESGNHNDTF